MLTWRVPLSGSKWGCESGGWLETLLSSPAVIRGSVGNAQFGGLEWREPRILLSMLDQSRSGGLSTGSSRGPDTGWAHRHLDQQIVSTIPVQILPGMEQHGRGQLRGGQDPYRASCHGTGWHMPS